MSQTGGIGMARYLSTGSIPVWQGTNKDMQHAQGSFALDKTGFSAGDLLPAGSPVVFNETTRVAQVLRTAISYANAASNATTYQVKKGSNLKVGDNLASGAVGGKAYPIMAIDTTTSTVYDTITVGTTIGAVTAGDTLYNSTATGATASALPAINGLLYEDTVVDRAGIQNSISAVIRGTVYARRIPYSSAIAAIPALDDIIFSQSY